MKGLLLKHFNTSTQRMIHDAVREIGFERPGGVILRIGSEHKQTLENLGDYFSWTLCAIEAVWGLIHAGILMPMSSQTLTTIPTTIQITWDRGGSGYSGGENFNNFGGVPFFPETVTKTRCRAEGCILADPDLYLENLRPYIPHPEAAEVLQEAVRCFRSELYMASVVMLGKASEGIWIELGSALIGALPKVEQSRLASFRSSLDSVNVGFAKKLRDIIKHYESKQTEYALIAKDACVLLEDVRLAAQWSETVRDSRNVVHYGKQPKISNNYENVATLLLSGSNHLRNLVALYNAALGHPGV